jgi:hypothetical protein
MSPPFDSVVVRDLYGVRIMSTPLEADPQLIVDSNAVLPLPIAAQFLQAIAGWDPQILCCLCAIKHGELSPRDGCGRRTFSFAGAPDFRRLLVGESLDHSRKHNEER